MLKGIVNLPGTRWHAGRYDNLSESHRRILGEFGEFAPCNEPGCEVASNVQMARDARSALAEPSTSRGNRNCSHGTILLAGETALSALAGSVNAGCNKKTPQPGCPIALRAGYESSPFSFSPPGPSCPGTA
ncbi:phage integrase family domain protein [Paraburkholderia xenovorans LB400]|nr:phage integrase family domain protein [Paraburkholderia xenovorans LB400]